MEVDVTDVTRRIFRSKIVIPVAKSGRMVLLYPKWLPGFHAPQAPIELLAGLEVRADEEVLRWIRHPVTVNAFEVDVPEGATTLEASFQFLSPTQPEHGRVLVSDDLLMLPWNTVVLYPAGYYARRIAVQAALTLPDEWHYASALDEESGEGGRVQFKTTTLDALVDSPVMAGRFFRREALDEEQEVYLSVAADRPELLEATQEQLAPHRAVVSQADALFGCRHFRRFEMLLALSGELTSAGVEHHQSFEAVSLPGYFTDWEGSFPRRDTIPHEYVHSWNGKHRRGADSWSPCFEKPIRNSLMWVYEGLTQYWTNVLAARSGLWTAEHALGAFAHTAATYEIRPGSQWRPLIDTTRDPIIAARNPLPWASWQRSEDYYSEGALVWLDVDTRIRELTGEKRSLDDFARAFFGPDDGEKFTHTYEFADVVATLDGIAAFDWKALFERLLTETRNGAPLEGLRRGGYRLEFVEQPNAYAHGLQTSTGTRDLTFSLGLKVTDEGNVAEVLWEGPAFDQGITSGTTILSVNGRTFSSTVLEEAVAATPAGESVRLVIKSGQKVREVAIEYMGGLRYPSLQAIPGQPHRLDQILAPR